MKLGEEHTPSFSEYALNEAKIILSIKPYFINKNGEKYWEWGLPESNVLSEDEG
jgi:hypothetical protein